MRTGGLAARSTASALVGVWLTLCTPAAAGTPGGTVELGFGMGFAVSHSLRRTEPPLETVTGIHWLPRVGYVITGEAGPPWLAGTLEILLEPTVAHLNAESSATVGGASALGRWIFETGWMARPYVEVGLGIVGGHTDFPGRACDVNFLVQGGPGLMIFVRPQMALTAAYRFHHISNAGSCEYNAGINSSLVTLGLSYFFP